MKNNKKKILSILNRLSIIIIILSFIGMIVYYGIVVYGILHQGIPKTSSIIGYICLFLIVDFALIYEITGGLLFRILMEEEEDIENDK